jgi:hypothetical protein
MTRILDPRHIAHKALTATVLACLSQTCRAADPSALSVPASDQWLVLAHDLTKSKKKNNINR